MAEKLTFEYVKKEVEKIGWKILNTEYKNVKQILNLVCNNNHDVKICWNNFQQGKRCVYCSGLDTKSYEFVFNDFKKIGWSLLSKNYLNSSQKLDVECNNGHKIKVSYGDFRFGRKCKICSGLEMKTLDFVKDEFSKKGYKLLSTEYKNANTKLEFICNNGHQTKISWGSFQQNQGCGYCSGRYVSDKNSLKINFPELIKEISSKNKIDIDSISYGSHKKLLWKCLKCNHEWFSIVKDRVSGKGCPVCKESHGEKLVKKLLLDLGFSNNEIKNQVKFDECVYKRKLPFDFGIFRKNNWVLIEYQGIQHYKPIEKFGGVTEFEELKIRDKIKVDFCKSNKYKLITISYKLKEKEILELLKKNLI